MTHSLPSIKPFWISHDRITSKTHLNQKYLLFMQSPIIWKKIFLILFYKLSANMSVMKHGVFQPSKIKSFSHSQPFKFKNRWIVPLQKDAFTRSIHYLRYRQLSGNVLLHMTWESSLTFTLPHTLAYNIDTNPISIFLSFSEQMELSCKNPLGSLRNQLNSRNPNLNFGSQIQPSVIIEVRD